jgi:hypothetical protein
MIAFFLITGFVQAIDVCYWRTKRTLPRCCGMSAIGVPAQPVDATQALNLSAGVSNCKVSRGRSLS